MPWYCYNMDLCAGSSTDGVGFYAVFVPRAHVLTEIGPFWLSFGKDMRERAYTEQDSAYTGVLFITLSSQHK
jgi:hypothetical protein